MTGLQAAATRLSERICCFGNRVRRSSQPVSQATVAFPPLAGPTMSLQHSLTRIERSLTWRNAIRRTAPAGTRRAGFLILASNSPYTGAAFRIVRHRRELRRRAKLDRFAPLAPRQMTTSACMARGASATGRARRLCAPLCCRPPPVEFPDGKQCFGTSADESDMPRTWPIDNEGAPAMQQVGASENMDFPRRNTMRSSHDRAAPARSAGR